MEFSKAIGSGSYTIVASVESMQEKCMRLKEIGSQLRDCFDEANLCVRFAESFWKSASSEVMISIYEQTAADTQALCTKLSGTIQKLGMLISLYDQAEQSIKTDSQRLPSIVCQ